MFLVEGGAEARGRFANSPFCEKERFELATLRGTVLPSRLAKIRYLRVRSNFHTYISMAMVWNGTTILSQLGTLH